MNFRLLLLACITLFGLPHFAVAATSDTMTFYCVGKQDLDSCAERIETTLAKIGCNLDTSKTDCDFGINSNNTVSDTAICSVKSNNCSAPFEVMFGGANCYSRKIVRISKAERIKNAFSSMFGGYSASICVRP